MVAVVVAGRGVLKEIADSKDYPRKVGRKQESWA